jgi:hypothetical protein
MWGAQNQKVDRQALSKKLKSSYLGKYIRTIEYRVGKKRSGYGSPNLSILPKKLHHLSFITRPCQFTSLLLLLSKLPANSLETTVLGNPADNKKAWLIGDRILETTVRSHIGSGPFSDTGGSLLPNKVRSSNRHPQPPRLFSKQSLCFTRLSSV